MKWLNPFRRRAGIDKRRIEEMIARVVRGMRYPVVPMDDGMWVAVAPPRNTYRTSLYVWADGGRIRCEATAPLFIERDLLGRELLLQLLESNTAMEPGVFRLSARGEERIVALADAIDARTTSERELRIRCERLIERYQRLIARLYAMEVIIPGPEPFTASPGRK